MADLFQVADQVTTFLAEKQPVKAQYTVSESETREITMENGEFTLFRTLFDQNISLSVIKNQKKGSTKINKFDKDAIKEAVEAAILAAESGTEDSFYDIAPGMEKETFHMGCEEPDIDRLMKRTLELSEDIKERFPKVLVMQIMCKHVKAHSVYRNTNGSEDEKNVGFYEIMVEFSGNDGEKTTGIAGTSATIKDLDTRFIELASIEKDLKDAEDALQEVDVKGNFEGQIILTPGCAGQVIYYALNNFVGNDNILDGTALWKGKIGEKVASDQLTVSLAPWDPRIINHEVHTADGFRSKDYTVIENGILQNYMTSLYVANKCQVPRAENSGFDIVVAAGDTALADMIKQVKKGLIVGFISCGTPGANGEISGVAKNSFYIEDGEIKGAATETMISGNLAEMLTNIVAVSKEQVCDGTMVIPYIGIDHIVIAGK